jgi:hypothetical protein
MAMSPPRLWPLTDCTTNYRPVLFSERVPPDKGQINCLAKERKKKNHQDGQATDHRSLHQHNSTQYHWTHHRYIRNKLRFILNESPGEWFFLHQISHFTKEGLCMNYIQLLILTHFILHWLWCCHCSGYGILLGSLHPEDSDDTFLWNVSWLLDRLHGVISEDKDLQSNFFTVSFFLFTNTIKKFTPWPESTSELYQLRNSRLLAKLVPVFADRECSTVSTMHSYGSFLGFLYWSHYYFFQVAPQLYSRDWVESIPDPLLLRKSGSAMNQTWDLWICSHELWPLDHRGNLINTIMTNKQKKYCWQNSKLTHSVACQRSKTKVNIGHKEETWISIAVSTTTTQYWYICIKNISYIKCGLPSTGEPTRGPRAAWDSSHFYKIYLFYNGQSSENQCIKKISPPSSRLEE